MSKGKAPKDGWNYTDTCEGAAARALKTEIREGRAMSNRAISAGRHVDTCNTCSEQFDVRVKEFCNK